MASSVVAWADVADSSRESFVSAPVVCWPATPENSYHEPLRELVDSHNSFNVAFQKSLALVSEPQDFSFLINEARPESSPEATGSSNGISTAKRRGRRRPPAMAHTLSASPSSSQSPGLPLPSKLPQRASGATDFSFLFPDEEPSREPTVNNPPDPAEVRTTPVKRGSRKRRTATPTAGPKHESPLGPGPKCRREADAHNPMPALPPQLSPQAVTGAQPEDSGCAEPATEEEWQLRIEKRKESVAIAKNSEEYTCFQSRRHEIEQELGEQAPRTPDVADRTMSKRKFKYELQQWRQQIHRVLAIPLDKEHTA